MCWHLTRPPPAQAGPAQLLLERGQFGPSGRLQEREGRTENLRPFPNPCKHLLPKTQWSPRGHPRRMGLCAREPRAWVVSLSGAAWKSTGQSQKHGHVCGLTWYDFIFAFCQDSFMKQNWKRKGAATGNNEKHQSQMLETLAIKVEISQPTCPSSDAHWKQAKQHELASGGNKHFESKF